MSIDSLLKKTALLQALAKPVEPETRLPYLLLDSDTGSDMPGYEQHNAEHRRLARRLRCSPKVYIGFNLYEEEDTEE